MKFPRAGSNKRSDREKQDPTKSVSPRIGDLNIGSMPSSNSPLEQLLNRKFF